ncbi:VOC family protein [Williamsia deligens]|uniref:VOC family protein n=1 Tax=Williamsia deligens TaxID=321325 RepID=A0ABW3G7S9_9NOCA|nr:VOC family protein [Williamsia deligens]MCP2192957.1 Catechol 2,3-dioxygenase [Williamsia deligens]
MSEFPRLANVVVDAVDVRTTAEFYRRLLGLVYRAGDEPPTDGTDDADWLVLYTAGGERLLAFQQADVLPATTWPSPEVPMQMHLCFYVDDPDRLDAEADRAQGLGATLRQHRTDDPDEPLYVLTDPAGHPFCLYTHPSVPPGSPL